MNYIKYISIKQVFFGRKMFFMIQCNNNIKTLLTKLKKVKYMSFMLVEKINKQVY